MTLSVFVYGTLKQGFGNHRLCEGAAMIEEAMVYGRMYDLGIGYPMMETPELLRLALGTENPIGDIETQAGYLKQNCEASYWEEPEGDWDLVSGELMTFTDPERRLPSLDSLEGFRPGRRSLYLRVLVPVQVPGNEATVAWCYVGAEGQLEGRPRKRIGRWH